MKYFADCKTAEEVKALYKKLAMKLHPDLGGSKEAFQAMYNEYEEAFDRLKNVHAAADGGTYERAAAPSETAQEFADLINQLVMMDGLKVELVGRWIWVTGDTFQHKTALKAAGFKWASKKKAWYWHTAEDSVSRGSKKSLAKIKQKYGCETFTPNNQPRTRPTLDT